MDDAHQTVSWLAGELGLELDALKSLKTNAYCRIYRAEHGGVPVLVKHYPDAAHGELARREAEAVDLYASLVSEHPGLLSCRTLAFNPGSNVLCTEFLQGELMAQSLHRARRDRAVREQCARAMQHVGWFLGRLRERTLVEGGRPSPFLQEYIRYTSRGLETLPGLGKTLFRGFEAQADELFGALCRADCPPSSVHGDLVFANMVRSGDRVGLIDFANTNDRSHPPNDLYNLAIALRSKRLGRRFRRALWEHMLRGLGPLELPPAVARFYWEFHRRRWLFLKLAQGGAVSRAQGVGDLLSLPHAPPRLHGASAAL